jgi:hypothetical protein
MDLAVKDAALDFVRAEILTILDLGVHYELHGLEPRGRLSNGLLMPKSLLLRLEALFIWIMVTSTNQPSGK